MEDKKYTKEELKIIKDRYLTKVLWMCLKLVFVFLIPALISVYLGKKLDVIYNAGEQKYVNFTLLASFILSWSVVVFYYKKASKGLREIDAKIEIAKTEP